MVSVPTLTKKLFVDLWRIKGQVLAVLLVQAAGISLLVMSQGMVASLSDTMEAYYDRYRFADVFASVVRAPRTELERIAEIDGVARVEGRISGGGLVDLPQMDAPVTAQLVSRARTTGPVLNDVVVVRGQMPSLDRPDEILLLQAFADIHGLKPGDSLKVTAYGAAHEYKIAGLAQSPEFIYALAPGSLAADDRRFAVIWASEEALEAAFDLEGAFNQAVLRLSRGANVDEVLAQVDRVLAPYGGRGAISRDDQVSNKFLSEELRQLETMTFIMAPIFMSVTIFLLNVVISRLVQTEREQIGLLKAFGYTDREIGMHYFQFSLVMAFGGALIGWGGGLYLGRLITELYQHFYHFPFLIFEPGLSTGAQAIVLSFIGAAVGAASAVRFAITLQPAVAMRPPAPEIFRHDGGLFSGIVSTLDRPTRMILRQLIRRPMRAGILTLGIGASMGLAVMMQFNQSAVDHILYASFDVTDQSDLSVTFPEARGQKAIVELSQLDGVTAVEPFRSAAVTFRNERKSYLGAVTGVTASPHINRVVNRDLQDVPVPAQGILLSTQLGKLMDVTVGETIGLDFRDGRQPFVEVSVIGFIDSMIGTPAYMQIESLNALLLEPGRVSGAHMQAEEEAIPALQRRFKEMPQIAGVTTHRDDRVNIDQMLEEGPGTFRRIMTFFSIVIAVGVVYNGARITFNERRHDLASLRVLGYTSAEAGYVVIGELIVITLMALPVGVALGVWIWTFISTALSTELYQIPTIVRPEGFGVAAVTILLSAVAACALIARDVTRLDMVEALKSRD